MNLVDNFRNGIKEYIKRSEWNGWDEGEFIKELGIKNIKLAFISEVMFGICTYDTGLDIEFGRDILEVMEVIYENKNYEYIKDRNNYKKFILVANLLDKYNWIEWGTSIRGCWFDYFSEFKLEIDDLEDFNMEEIIFDNEEGKDIGELIKYLKNEEL